MFNEMKGVYSSPDSLFYRTVQNALFPDNTYRWGRVVQLRGVGEGGGAGQAPPEGQGPLLPHNCFSYTYIYTDAPPGTTPAATPR